MAGPTSYSLEDGRVLVSAARSAIELCIKSPKFDRSMVEGSIERFTEHSGVFVTLEHYPTMTLRGCIGFPEPSGPLKSLLVEAAIAAATEDPRFMPVSHQELGHLVVEVSILSKPERIIQKSASGRLKEVKVGRDGLVIRYGFKSGLLLPVVPVEQGWNKEEFLGQTCVKAGMPEDAWRRPEIELYKFTAKVFKESEPGGSVEEVALG